MILENLASFIGALLKHIIGVLLLCWRRMLRAGLIAFAIGVVVTVLIVVISTGEAIPDAPALIVALLLGLALAYGVALTVLIEELILGIIDLIRMIEGDLSVGAHITEVVAEREVGQVGQGLRRLIGLPVSKRPPARPGATLPPLTRAQPQSQPARPPAAGLVETGAAVAAKAATAAAISAAAQRATTPPAPAPSATKAETEPTGEPVPADRLPRIAWTYEHEAIRPPTTAPAPTPAAPTAPAVEPAASPPIAEAAPPGASAASPPPPARGDLPNTLSELAGGAEAAPEPPALEAPYEDERLAAPAGIATPEGPAEPAERGDDAEEAPEVVSMKPVELAPEWTESPSSAAHAVVDAPAEPTEAAEIAGDASVSPPAGRAAEPAQEGAPASRSDLSRLTQPLSDEGATLEGPRTGAVSGPRPSAPESGLWERLSNALVNRASVPSGPFAPAPPLSDESAADESAREPGTGDKA